MNVHYLFFFFLFFQAEFTLHKNVNYASCNITPAKLLEMPNF